MSNRRGTLDVIDMVIDPNAPAPPPGQDELPSEDGEPMDTPRHRDQMNLLIETLTSAWSDRHDYYVGGNMFVYFSELQSRGEHFRGPDFFLVLDTERERYRKSWVAWQEGGRLPDLVIELLSESTADVDRGEKKRIYERIWRTQYYVMFDVETLQLEAYELVHGRYAAMKPDASGVLAMPGVGLSLVVGPGRFLGNDDDWLRLADGTGRPFPTSEERADAERARANAEQARADAEQVRADAERARAEAAEKRLAALEAKLPDT